MAKGRTASGRVKKGYRITRHGVVKAKAKRKTKRRRR